MRAKGEYIPINRPLFSLHDKFLKVLVMRNVGIHSLANDLGRVVTEFLTPLRVLVLIRRRLLLELSVSVIVRRLGIRRKTYVTRGPRF